MFLFLSVFVLVLANVGCAADPCRTKKTVNHWNGSAVAPIGQSSIPINPVPYKYRSFSVPTSDGGMVHSSYVQGTDTYVQRYWQGGNRFTTVVTQVPYRYEYKSYTPNYYQPRTYLDPKGPKPSYHRWPK